MIRICKFIYICINRDPELRFILYATIHIHICLVHSFAWKKGTHKKVNKAIVNKEEKR